MSISSDGSNLSDPGFSVTCSRGHFVIAHLSAFREILCQKSFQSCILVQNTEREAERKSKLRL